MYWNCQGFPWHKGVATDELFGDADIVMLGETWERETGAIPNIPGYMVQSITQKATGKRGQGGVACIYWTYLQDRITVAKVDKYHRYIWLKITCGTQTYFLACCYIPHRESVFYKGHGADPANPFGDLGMDVCHFTALGKVMIMG